MSLKNPVTTTGIDPGTVRLVAQHLNHYATQDPISKQYTSLLRLIFTMKMAAQTQAETLEQFQHSTYPNLKAEYSYTGTHRKDILNKIQMKHN